MLKYTKKDGMYILKNGRKIVGYVTNTPIGAVYNIGKPSDHSVASFSGLMSLTVEEAKERLMSVMWKD